MEDALAAAAAGADAIGLNFHPASPRLVSLEQARAIVDALPPLVTTVGVFVNHSRAAVEEILRAVPLDLLQFHGDESPEQCLGYGRPYIKALRVGPGVDLVAQVRTYAGAKGILLDAYVPGQPGGTGQAFDWSLIPALDVPLILAGGLTARNVGEAIRRVRPWAVDVAGGVEKDRGIKDSALVSAFVRAVQGASQ